MRNSDSQKQKAARTTRSQKPLFGAAATQPFFAGTEGVQRKPFFGAGPEHSFFSQGHGVQREPFFKGAGVQAKLTVGAVGDKYEQEADRVAADVVARINGGQTTSEQAKVQRMGEEEDDLQMKPMTEEIQRMGMEEDDLQMKPMSETIQRMGIDEEDDLQMKPMTEQIQRMGMEEEEELQMKATLQRVGHEGGEASTDFETEIQSAKGGGQALTHDLQAQMGQAMGADFSRVRVHTDAQSDQLNQSIQAKAFTTGQDVFFRQGEYQPESRGGQELIAHELTHVMQQQRNPKMERMNGNSISQSKDSNQIHRFADATKFENDVRLINPSLSRWKTSSLHPIVVALYRYTQQVTLLNLGLVRTAINNLNPIKPKYQTLINNLRQELNQDEITLRISRLRRDPQIIYGARPLTRAQGKMLINAIQHSNYANVVGLNLRRQHAPYTLDLIGNKAIC